MAASTAIGLSLASSAYSVYKASQGPKTPPLPTMPVAPPPIDYSTGNAQAQARRKALQKPGTMGGTLLTGPQGASLPPVQAQRQTLLGL